MAANYYFLFIFILTSSQTLQHSILNVEDGTTLKTLLKILSLVFIDMFCSIQSRCRSKH